VDSLIGVTICVFKSHKFELQTKTFIKTTLEDAELLYNDLPQTHDICVCYEGMSNEQF
jgi:hypothetical protein